MNASAQFLSHAVWLKPFLLLLLLPLLALAQHYRPRRGDASLHRWRINLALAAFSTVLLAFLPVLAIGVAAQWAQAEQFGLLYLVDLPPPARWLATWVMLDFAIYWQHRAFHALPLLWRAHRAHHLDDGFDVSLGLRFHPLEILPSALFKSAVVIAIGAPPAAAIGYEALLLAMSLFTHADLALPRRLDAVLRWLVVTPDWHRVHHSPLREETNSNYGNWLSLWDRLFGSYRPQPRDGHTGMRIGLDGYDPAQVQRLSAVLANPFHNEPATPESPHA